MQIWPDPPNAHKPSMARRTLHKHRSSSQTCGR